MKTILVLILSVVSLTVQADYSEKCSTAQQKYNDTSTVFNHQIVLWNDAANLVVEVPLPELVKEKCETLVDYENATTDVLSILVDRIAYISDMRKYCVGSDKKGQDDSLLIHQNAISSVRAVKVVPIKACFILLNAKQ